MQRHHMPEGGAAAPPAAATRTLTLTETVPQPAAAREASPELPEPGNADAAAGQEPASAAEGAPSTAPTLRLHLTRRRRVHWTSDTHDNEHENKRSSKSCCIYHKARSWDESSTESDEDPEDHDHEHDHDHDHDGCDGGARRKPRRKGRRARRSASSSTTPEDSGTGGDSDGSSSSGGPRPERRKRRQLPPQPGSDVEVEGGGSDADGDAKLADIDSAIEAAAGRC